MASDLNRPCYYLTTWQLILAVIVTLVFPEYCFDLETNNGPINGTATTRSGYDEWRAHSQRPTAARTAFPISGEQNAPSEYLLYTKILERYSNSCRPRKNALDPVMVTMQLDLFAIDDIREREHAIYITATLNMEWIDEFLVWNTTEFKPINPMVFPSDRIWIPDFAMITAENMYTLRLAKGININVYNDGKVNFNPKTGFKSTCQFDLTYFPFDSQHCEVTFESWTYLPNALYFNLKDPPITTKKFIENEQWQLDNTSANAYVSCPIGATGSDCNAGASFSFFLSRKSNYYNLNIIIPSVIISIAEISTFTIPIGEPMKIHISFTCLLAFSVFQTAINADMPRTSDHTPLLSMYIVLIMAYIALAIIGESFVFFSLALAKRKTPLPEYVKTCFIYIGFALCISREKVEDLADDMLDEMSESGHETRDLRDMPKSIRAAIGKTAEYKTMEDKYGIGTTSSSYDTMIRSQPIGLDRTSVITPDVHARDWFYVAVVSSRLTCIIYLALIFVTPLFMFLATPASQPKLIAEMGNLTVGNFTVVLA